MIPIDVRISSAHNQKKQAPKKKRFMGDPFSAMQVEDSEEEVESKISSIKVIARDYKEKEIQGRREYFDKMKIVVDATDSDGTTFTAVATVP